MTRLRTEWIAHITEDMQKYNHRLKTCSGLELRDLVLQIAGCTESELSQWIQENPVAVVSVTQGEGIISTFAECIAAILEAVGCQADVMTKTDISGIHEGLSKGYDLFFFADDDRYLAVNMGCGLYGENDRCTALGYIRVLDAMMAMRGFDIRKERILLAGYGRVGREAEQILRQEGITFDLYEKDFDKISHLDYHTLYKPSEISNYPFILDFTNQGDWLHAEYLQEGAIYASPGVPCSLDDGAKKVLGSACMYDDLEIGTVAMLARVIDCN